ncbi:MAG: uridine kinase [Sphaerochaetaceae bacterium]|nr:uridine kinase [Sphaerochaetaceae bacterium]
MAFSDGEVKVIGITGGSGSGKSTIVRKINEVCSSFAFIPMDNYYKSASFVNNSNITAVNFDHPNAFDMDLLHSHIKDLKEGKAIDMPIYDFVRHCRTEETVHLEPAKLVIVEGLMTLYDEEIRKLLDLKIFVDTPADIRFIRRLKRDIAERGRTVDSVITQYLEVVRPGHMTFIEPTKDFADIIIPEGGHNEQALKVLLAFVKDVS